MKKIEKMKEDIKKLEEENKNMKENNMNLKLMEIENNHKMKKASKIDKRNSKCIFFPIN